MLPIHTVKMLPIHTASNSQQSYELHSDLHIVVIDSPALRPWLPLLNLSNVGSFSFPFSLDLIQVQ